MSVDEAVAVANIDFETEELSLSSGDVFVGI